MVKIYTMVTLSLAWLWLAVSVVVAEPLFTDSFDSDSSKRFAELRSGGALTVGGGTWRLETKKKSATRALQEPKLDGNPGYAVSFTLGRASSDSFAVWLHARGETWWDLEGIRIGFAETALDVKTRHKRGTWNRTPHAVFEGVRRKGAQITVTLVRNRFVEVSVDGRLQGKFFLESFFADEKTRQRTGTIALETTGMLELTDLRIDPIKDKKIRGFSIGETFDVLEDPYLVIANDVDGDGHKDLVVAHRGAITEDPSRAVDKVSILYGKGVTFEPARHLSVGQSPFTVEVTDANADGHKDLLVASFFEWEGRHITVLLGKGKRNFETPKFISLPDREPLHPKGPEWPAPGATSLVARDFNDDGIVDIAAVGWTVDTLYILLGKGDGNFEMHDIHQHQDYGFGFRDVKSGDLNRDGKLDLAVTASVSNHVTLFEGGDDGKFTFTRRFSSSGTKPYHLALGDIDNDGDQDIVVGNDGGNVRALIHWTGWDFENGGTYTQFGTSESTSNQVKDVLLRDLNDDGLKDLIVACSNPKAGYVSVAFGTGDFNRGHYFGRSVQYYLGKSPHSIFIDDLDGDERLDMAVVRLGGNDVIVLRGSPQ